LSTRPLRARLRKETIVSIFRRRSFTETVEGRRRFLGRAGVFILVFLAFEIITGAFVATFSVTSRSMTPSVLAGDFVLASPLPFGPRTLFGKLPPLGRPERGDIVLLRPPFERRDGAFALLADALLRFVSFQRLSFLDHGSDATLYGPFVERVIAVPGDEVSMADFVFMVRSSGSLHPLTEFEYSTKRYDIHKPKQPAGWKEGYPLSGEMAPRLLSRNEYFVASDDRASTGDS